MTALTSGASISSLPSFSRILSVAIQTARSCVIPVRQLVCPDGAQSSNFIGCMWVTDGIVRFRASMVSMCDLVCCNSSEWYPDGVQTIASPAHVNTVDMHACELPLDPGRDGFRSFSCSRCAVHCLRASYLFVVLCFEETDSKNSHFVSPR